LITLFILCIFIFSFQNKNINKQQKNIDVDQTAYNFLKKTRGDMCVQTRAQARLTEPAGWVRDRLLESPDRWLAKIRSTVGTSQEARLMTVWLSATIYNNPRYLVKAHSTAALHHKVSFERDFCLFERDLAISFYFAFQVRFGFFFSINSLKTT
jgi:hypothetical protein